MTTITPVSVAATSTSTAASSLPPGLVAADEVLFTDPKQQLVIVQFDPARHTDAVVPVLAATYADGFPVAKAAGVGADDLASGWRDELRTLTTAGGLGVFAVCTAPTLPAGAPANRVMGFGFVYSGKGYVERHLGTCDPARLTALVNNGGTGSLTQPGPVASTMPAPGTAANRDAFNAAMRVHFRDVALVIVQHFGVDRLCRHTTGDVGVASRFGVHPAYAHTNGRVLSTIAALAAQQALTRAGVAAFVFPVANTRTIHWSLQKVKAYGFGRVVGRLPWSVYGQFHPAFAAAALRGVPNAALDAFVFAFDPHAPVTNADADADAHAVAHADATTAPAAATAAAAPAPATTDAASTTSLNAAALKTTALPEHLSQLGVDTMRSFVAAAAAAAATPVASATRSKL